MLSVSPTRRQGTTIPAGDTLFLSPVYAGQRGEVRPPRGAAILYCYAAKKYMIIFIFLRRPARRGATAARRCGAAL